MADLKTPIQKNLHALRCTPHVRDYETWRRSYSWETAKEALDWFERDRSINICYEAIDRHDKTWRRNKVALVWEAKDGHRETWTFAELKRATARFASFLQSHGVK